MTIDYEKTAEGKYAYKYPRAAHTSDTLVLAKTNFGIFVLLVKRGNQPEMGKWAFPGGFMNMDETTEQCARRELKEGTGLVLDVDFRLVGVYSDIDRDPRGRVVTTSYLALLSKCEPAKAGDDAAEIQWFNLDDLPKLAFDHDKMLKDALAMI